MEEQPKTCKAPNCSRDDIYRKGECSLHYRRMQKYGTYEASALQKPGPKPDPTKERSRHNPDNPQRKRRPKGRVLPTHCPQGHPYDEENTYTYVSGAGHTNRQCRACRRDRREKVVEGPGRGAHNSAKTHCPKGHEYTEENTYLWQGNKRICRACQTIKRHEKTIPKQYGITHEHYLGMLEEQGGACAICRAPFGDVRPHIDHDHACCPGRYTCGKCNRGLLCGDCNTGIGKLKDSAELLRAAAGYLESFVIPL